MVEDSRPYAVDVLELQGQSLRLRSHNPGTPVEMTLAAVEAAAQPLPQRFQGRWAATRKDCARPGQESRLELTGDTVRFHESSGSVLAALVDPREPARVDLVMRLRGEGSTRLAWRRLQLAADGASLADLTEAAGGLARVRCE
jgi:hypothetical protein